MRKHCKRKIWATTGFDAVAHAIAGACITNDASLSALRLRELSALDAMVHGLGTEQEWRDLVDVTNLCETSALLGTGPEALPFCAAANDALDQADVRFKASGRMGLSGEGITAIREVIEYHDLQRRSIARSEYEKLIRKTADRVRSKQVRLS